MRGILLSAIAFSLVACPEAPSNLEGGGPPSEGENQQHPTVDGEMNNGGSNNGGSNNGAAGEVPPIVPNMDTIVDEPVNSQEDLANDDSAITVSGTIICESGTGPYRVRIFVPPPSEGGPEADNEGTPPGPLAATTVAQAGAFSFLTPGGEALKILAYEDKDDNGVPTPEETQFGTAGGGLSDLSSDLSGVILNCSNSAPSPDPLPINVPINTEHTPDGATNPDSTDGTHTVGTTMEGGEIPGPPGPPTGEELAPADGAQGPAPAGLPPAPSGE
jgi:hypothetical protein